MKKDELIRIATEFRKAIFSTIEKRECFLKNDRLYNFPKGCCDDTAELFAYYLLDKYGLHAEQINGVRTDGDGNRQNHEWVRMPSKLIVDLTVDQFHCFKEHSNEIYVGTETAFHKEFREQKVATNSILDGNERLLHDYRMICKNMEDTPKT